MTIDFETSAKQVLDGCLLKNKKVLDG